MDKEAQAKNQIWMFLAVILIVGVMLVVFLKPQITGRIIEGENGTEGNETPIEETTTLAPVCVENWSCTDWGECTEGTQTKTCTDANVCGTEIDKPVVSQTCEVNLTEETTTLETTTETPTTTTEAITTTVAPATTAAPTPATSAPAVVNDVVIKKTTTKVITTLPTTQAPTTIPITETTLPEKKTIFSLVGSAIRVPLNSVGNVVKVPIEKIKQNLVLSIFVFLVAVIIGGFFAMKKFKPEYLERIMARKTEENSIVIEENDEED